MLRDDGSSECLHDILKCDHSVKAAERCFPNIKNGRGGKEEVFVLMKAVLTLESVDRILK